MHISTHIKNDNLAQALHLYVERRLQFALARFGNRVGEVTVKITADSPANSRCRISTEVLPFGRVVADECDASLFTAIDRATGRIGRLFSRKLERGRDPKDGRQSIRAAA